MASPNTSALVKGGYLRRSTNRIGFITHTIPIIHQNSRIIGVCGVSKEDADPSSDGWFFSDFFATNYLIKGLGASQTWIATSSAEDLVENHKEFLHGNPYRDRKVVLNGALLRQGEITPVIVTPEAHLHSRIIEVLRKECRIAKLTQAPVLLFLFGHGDERTYGVELGEESILGIDEVRCAIEDDTRLTIISTACFSGGWSASTFLNATTSTAAGPTIMSESWNESPSVRKRNCGSIYASALINTLINTSSPLVKPTDDVPITGSIQPPELSSTQIESFNEFARSIHDTLLDIDPKFGGEHQISFSAQDDDWEASWTGRTGVPLCDFIERWNKLETRASTAEPGSPLDRSTPSTGSSPQPDITMTVQEFRGLSLSRLGSRTHLGALFGGSPASQKRHVKRIARALLQTCPGSWNKGYGPKNRYELRKFVQSPDEDFGDTADMFCILKYRFDMLHYADVLTSRLDVPRPLSKYCFQFDWDEWYSHMQDIRGTDGKILFEKCFRTLSDSAVFQKPTKDQGRGFLHPQYYISAAIVDASPTLDDAETYIGKVIDITDRHMRANLDHVLRASSVRIKGARWLKTIGRTIRELSPRKRESSSATIQP